MKHTNELLLDIMESISALKLELVQLIPDVLGGLLILIIGIFAAYLIKWSSSVVVRWSLRLLPNSIFRKEFLKTNFETILNGFCKILFFITIFIAIAVSFKKMGLQLVSDWMQGLGKYFPNILGSVLILYFGWKAKELLEDLLLRTLTKTSFPYSATASKTFSWGVFVISVLVSLEQIGIDMSLVVSISTVLVGVIAAGAALTFALGAKATISDILYCFQLHKYFKVGQEIKINAYHGRIKAIGPIFVLVETDRGNITVPGSMFNREIAMVSGSEPAKSE